MWKVQTPTLNPPVQTISEGKDHSGSVQTPILNAPVQTISEGKDHSGSVQTPILNAPVQTISEGKDITVINGCFLERFRRTLKATKVQRW